jgi:hypothetical protein
MITRPVRPVTRLEPVHATNIINNFRHDNNEDYSEDHSGNQKHNHSKERQLQNQIYMEKSVFSDVGQNINVYV